MEDGEIQDALVAHLARCFPGRAVERLPATAHARGELPGLEVARIAPGPGARGEPWVYATLGAWHATKDTTEGLELILLSPVEARQHVDTLSSCAYFHSFYGLDLGRTMKVARGWLPDGLCDRLLLTTPRFLPEVETCALGERSVRFLWLFPITPDEEKFLKANGAAALEQKLSDASVNPCNVRRPSVVE